MTTSGRSLMLLDLPYLYQDEDRHGNARLFVRRHGRKVRIREVPGTSAFTKAYSAALDALAEYARAPDQSDTPKPAPDKTVGWLAALYFASDEFKSLETRWCGTRRLVIEHCLFEPINPESKILIRDVPVGTFGANHMLMLMERKAGKPGAQRNRLKYMSTMFSWGVQKRKCASNPCRDVKGPKKTGPGFRAWTMEDYQTFTDKHPLGTTAYLALHLMLLLGARRGDAAVLGPRNIRMVTEVAADGRKTERRVMTYVPRKARHLGREATDKPILPALAEAIRATPIGLQTFLVTSFGKPFSDNGLGNKMREWCDEAELPECSAHGLKKLGATLCADNGANEYELCALFDWTDIRQATPYTRAANKRKLAAQAGARLASAMAVPPVSKSEVG